MTEEGTSMGKLASAARELGFAADAYKLRSIGLLAQLTSATPAIVIVRGSHFVLAWGDGDEGVWIADYPGGIEHATIESLKEEADPRVLVLRRPETPSPFRTWTPLRRGMAISLALCMIALGWTRSRLPRTRSRSFA